MTKQKKNKIVTAAAILLLTVAVFLTVQLFVGEDSNANVDETVASTLPATDFTSESEHTAEYGYTAESEHTASETTAYAKYLWEYGPDNAKFDKPSELK